MNTVTATAEAFAECFSQFRLLGPITQNMLRTCACDRLLQLEFNEIGSSDINCELFNMWDSAGGDWQKAILFEVDNPS